MSDFEDNFDGAYDVIDAFLGEAATFYYAAAPSTGYSVTPTFNEQVGAIDGFRRAVFTVDADAEPFATTAPLRGDFFVLSGETDRWVVVDVRDDKAGAIELRCDGTLVRQ